MLPDKPTITKITYEMNTKLIKNLIRSLYLLQKINTENIRNKVTPKMQCSVRLKSFLLIAKFVILFLQTKKSRTKVLFNDSRV